jgi:undecaprenyl-diphosphatase
MADTPVREEHEGLSHILVEDHEWAWRFAVLLWAVAGLLFVAMAIPPIRDAIQSMDDWIYDTTYAIKIAAITPIAYLFNFIGGGIFAWPFRMAITAILVAKKRWEAVAAWLLALAMSEPFIWLLKNLYGRERPPEALVEATSGSFPSGHSIGGAVMAVGLVVAFIPAGPERRNLEIVAAAFAFVMGGSRMYLGAHYFTDVVSGVAFGAAAAIGAAVITHRFYVRRFIRQREAAFRALQQARE